MPRWDALQDMRVVKIALATIAAGPTPLTRKAARDLLADPSARFAGEGRASRLQVLDALGAALDPGACATDAGQSIELPLPPRPVFAPGTDNSIVICRLWGYYGDISDFRKFSVEDRAYVEHCLRGLPPRRVAQAMWTMLDAVAATDEEVPDPGPLLERMRKVSEIPQELRAPWKSLHIRALELEGKSSPSGKWLKMAHQTLAGLSPQQKIGLLTAVLDMPGPAEVLARAVVYLSAEWSPDAVGPILVRYARNVCFQSISGLGMRDERLGNACLWALIRLPAGGGVPYLARAAVAREISEGEKAHRGSTERGSSRGQHHPRRAR